MRAQGSRWTEKEAFFLTPSTSWGEGAKNGRRGLCPGHGGGAAHLPRFCSWGTG